MKTQASQMAVLRKLRYVLPRETKLTVYKALVKPHLMYCCTILNYASAEAIRDLQVTINMGLRAILNVPMETRVSDMLAELGMLAVKDEVYVATMVFIHKIIKGLMPPYLRELLTQFNQRHGYHTRHNCDLVVPLHKSEFLKKGIFKESRSYNNLTRDIKEAKSVDIFKRMLLEKLKSGE